MLEWLRTAHKGGQNKLFSKTTIPTKISNRRDKVGHVMDDQQKSAAKDQTGEQYSLCRTLRVI